MAHLGTVGQMRSKTGTQSQNLYFSAEASL